MLSAIDESAIVINSADEEGWAPLHSAASIGNLEIVEVLLSRGRIFFFFFLYFVSCDQSCFWNYFLSCQDWQCIVYLESVWFGDLGDKKTPFRNSNSS